MALVLALGYWLRVAIEPSKALAIALDYRLLSKSPFFLEKEKKKLEQAGGSGWSVILVIKGRGTVAHGLVYGTDKVMHLLTVEDENGKGRTIHDGSDIPSTICSWAEDYCRRNGV